MPETSRLRLFVTYTKRSSGSPSLAVKGSHPQVVESGVGQRVEQACLTAPGRLTHSAIAPSAAGPHETYRAIHLQDRAGRVRGVPPRPDRRDLDHAGAPRARPVDEQGADHPGV